MLLTGDTQLVFNTFCYCLYFDMKDSCKFVNNLFNTMYFFPFKVHKLDPYGTYQFRIMAENKFGISDGCESDKVVLQDPFGLPGPPRNPKIVSWTSSSMVVTWEPPLNNGGSMITGYWLEKRERGAVYWGRVNRAPVTKPAVKGLEYKVLRLIEGSEYQFRVMAVNAAGIGPPSEATECRTAIDAKSK